MEMNELAEEIFKQAISHQLDDIHLLPIGEEYVFYLRDVNGLKELRKVSTKIAEQFISYLKYQAGMDVGERRRPQSGSLTFEISGHQIIELRLSIITNFKQKESMVIRLLHRSQKENSSIQATTYFPKDWKLLEQFLRYKSGLILFSGPVSSGKTSTMYSLLRGRMNEKTLQVITMEDPVEYHEPMFLQTEINEKAGITYELLIKSCLRHHPDVLLIGEIRDEMTAKMAIRAALTGHLILATVHAKDCNGVISRLIELGVSKTMLEQTIIAICSQRLLPRYCALCHQECQIYCNHLANGEKRGTIFEIETNRKISDFLNKNQFERDEERIHPFNKVLRKAYALGYITEKTYETYQII